MLDVETIITDRQDYIFCPDQLWLADINTGYDSIHQNLAMSLGNGYTIKASVTGTENCSGIQLTVFEPSWVSSQENRQFNLIHFLKSLQHRNQ